jgi:alcohol dehydrogenase class IV
MSEITQFTTRRHAHSAADEMDQTARNDRIERIPSSELIDELVDIIDELVRRLGSDEVARQLGVSLDEFQAFIEAARAGLADERQLDA